MPKLPFPEIDVLVVDQIGKDISGDGMDPNITGTFCSRYASGGGLRAEHVVALDLTDASHGCAVGMGMCDFITRRFYDKIDLDITYPNSITSKMTVQVKIPMVLATDKQAIQIALRTCYGSDTTKLRVLRIKDTLHLEDFWISEALLPQAEALEKVQVLSRPEEWLFDANGVQTQSAV